MELASILSVHFLHHLIFRIFSFVRVGKESQIKYLVLQVHYAHLDKIPEEGDSSGIFLHYTRHPQPKTAGVLLLGTSGFAPKHSTTYFETACQMNDDREIHPFAFRTHTHSLGKVVSGWRVQNMSHWDLIGKRDPQKPQMFYPVADEKVTLKPGDVVAARCTMVNISIYSCNINSMIILLCFINNK